MAKLYGEIAAKSLLTLDKSFARANGQPLDASEVYYSLQAAKDYAAGAQAYIGQKIVVIEDGVVTHYSVEDTAGNLKELGAKPVADGTTIAIGADGKITLANITATEATGTYNAVLVNGKLTWVKPSETTVEGLSDLIQALTGRVDTAEADIDALQTAVGVAAKDAVGEEGSEGYEPAVAATGLYKAIADEVARAKAAEQALNEAVEAIDFVDNDELTAALEPYAKTAELPVKGVAEGDKVLSVTDALIGATLSLDYDSEAKAIKLYGKDNAVLGSVSATPFIKDGMLQDVEYNPENNTLTFTWNTDSSDGEPKTDTVVLSDIIEPYTAGVGLELNGNEFKAKLADGSENFLTITADGIKLAGIATAISTAKQEAIDGAATAAAGIYATQTALGNLETALDERLDVLEAIDHTAYTTNTVFNEYKTTVGNTYATKAELEPVAQDAANAKTAVGNLETRFDEIVAVGGEPNAINKIQVNGSELTITDKTVNIVVPTKASDLTDDTGFDARITAAQNAADGAQGTANEAKTAAAQAQSEVDALEITVGEIQTTVSGHTTSIGDHTTRIGALEQADIAHTAEYNTLSGIVSGHTEAIAKKADQTAVDAVVSKASANETAIQTLNETTIPAINGEIAKKANSADVYTKTEVGTIAEGKTLVEMINEAKSEATYDDTAVKQLISNNTSAIENIYKVDGETKSGVLVTEIARVEGLVSAEAARAKEVEGDHEERIAEMEAFWSAADDPAGTIDKLAEIVSYIEADKSGALDMAADIQANTNSINAIYTPGSGETPASGILAVVQEKANANEAAIAAINNADTGILAQANANIDAAIKALPAATSMSLGLVKYDDETIKMNNDKQLYVAKVSTDILEQGSAVLVLNGGTAKA